MGNAEHDAMARSRAEALFNKQRAKHGEFHRAGEKEWREDAAKAARLRELRLAKEREEAERRRPRRAASRRVSHPEPR
jgi:hypothetical protein